MGAHKVLVAAYGLLSVNTQSLRFSFPYSDKISSGDSNSV
jgi:hypothetical protein